jgi:hypothetical protein
MNRLHTRWNPERMLNDHRPRLLCNFPRKVGRVHIDAAVFNIYVKGLRPSGQNSLRDRQTRKCLCRNLVASADPKRLQDCVQPYPAAVKSEFGQSAENV